MRQKKTTIEEFIFKFKKLYPDLEIIKFTKISDEIIVRDKDGFYYKKNSASFVFKNDFTIESVINKVEYLNFKLKKILPDLTIIKYNGMKEKCLVKDNNGFYYTPKCCDLLSGHPVSIQTCSEKEKLFEYKANIRHNNIYEYNKFIYKNGKQKINIKCKLHGNFMQSIESHLSGKGCSKCMTLGFSKGDFIKKLRGKDGILYVLKFFNNDEEFIKVGITSSSVLKRYCQMKYYNYEIIKIVKDSANKIYDLEKIIIKKYRKYQYIPKIKFNGYTECFKIDKLKEIIYESDLHK